jgi:hypothetical protein
MWWYAVDLDPIAVAALAVNAHLWDLGPHVVIGHADTSEAAGARAPEGPDVPPDRKSHPSHPPVWQNRRCFRCPPRPTP